LAIRNWSKIKAKIASWRVGILPGIIVIGLIILIRISGYFQYLEWQALDYFLHLRPEEPIDERIVILGINEADIKSAGSYPIPDRNLAELLVKLETYKPLVVQKSLES
jgi:CHASE2 domain-containing sensor protein